MRTLDRSRSFGEICGPTSGTARYEQDGFLFDAKGHMLPGQIKYVEPEKVEPKPEPIDIQLKEGDYLQGRMVKPDPEQQALAMASEGKTKAEIRKATGLHHKVVERLMKIAKT